MANNCLLLLKVQLLNSFNFNRLLHSNDKKEKRKIVSFIALSILIIVIVFVYSFMAAYGYSYIGFSSIVPLLMMIIASFFSLGTVFFKAGGILFSPKDYDCIMSLPVSEYSYIISKYLYMYILSFIFTILIMLPGEIVYGIFSKPSIWFYVLYTISIFFVPMFPIVIACIVSSVIAMISSRMKHSNLINILLSLTVVIAVILFSSSSQELNIETISEINKLATETIFKTYPLALLFNKGVTEYNLVYFLGYILISIVALSLFVYFTATQYSKIINLLKSHKQKADYKLGFYKSSSSFVALYKKEIKRYFSSSIYVTNTLIGGIMLIIFAISLCFFEISDILTVMEIPNSPTQDIVCFIPLVEAMIISLCCTTSSSISLEGKNKWILVSMPIKSSTIYLSKIAVNLTLAIPCIILSSIILVIRFQTTSLQTLWMFVIPILYSILNSEIGLLANLLFPNYTWENEVYVVKQSLPPMVAMLFNLGITIILLFVLINIGVINSNLFYLCFTLFSTFLIFVVYLINNKIKL